MKMNNSQNIVGSVLETICRAIGHIPKKYHSPIALFIGTVWFSLDKRHRRVTIDNLEKAYQKSTDQASFENLAKKIFKNFCQLLLETCWAMTQHRDKLDSYIDRRDFRFVNEALKKGKGALILTGHLGNWELLPYVPSLEGVKSNAVYRPLDFKPMDQFVIQMRSRLGTDLIPSKNALRKIIYALKRNEIIGLLIDQNSDPHNGVAIEFFGRPTFGSKGLALIARQTGAPVVPGFLLRNKDGFKVVSGPEIPFIRTGDPQKDIEINTQRYNMAIEKVVRQYPEQWFWLHRRWKDSDQAKQHRTTRHEAH